MGQVIECLGCNAEEMGLTPTVGDVIRANGIQPWPARSLVKDNLQKQAILAKRSPLRNVPVEVGLQHFGKFCGGWYTKLTRDKFVQCAIELFLATGVRHSPKDRDELFDVFDSMDFDRNGELSVGEWAGGLSVFFRGTQEECVNAVFEMLDTNKSKSVSRRELMEYLKPFVKAMTPIEAEALRAPLLKKATDEIYRDMDMDHRNDISPEEMVAWSKRGNNVVDRIADIIEHEVYQAWLKENERNNRMQYAQGSNANQQYGQNPYGQNPYGQNTYGQAPPGQRPYPQSPYGQPPYYYGNQPPPNQNQGFGSWLGSWGGTQQQDPYRAQDYMGEGHRNSVYGGGW